MNIDHIKNVNKLNIFWILIDSARNFETCEDNRGLPKSVVEFAEDAIYYKNVVTSAPSTIQSISSMMTSVPSYLLARSYNNFRGISDNFDYFPHMLKENGYQIYGAIYFKHGREVMADMFGMMKNHFYPKGLNHRKEVWNNVEVYNLFLKVLEKNDWQQPTMCYLHYNVRVDLNVSTVIEDTINKIEEKGLMDNSIIIINSDHGYPMVDRGWDPLAEKKEGWGHDKLLYNDNILTPLIIKYPNCEPQQIDDFIQTIDIAPSLCRLLGIKPSSKFWGKNIINSKIELRKRLLRTDNRYVGQLPSYTSFIQGENKCIIYKNKSGNDSVEYFDLEKDPSEKNILKFNDQFKELKSSIDNNNRKFHEFHCEMLFDQWSKIKKVEKFNNPSSIIILLDSTPAFKTIVKDVFKQLFPESKIVISKDLEEKNINNITYDILFVIIESELPWDMKPIESKYKSKSVVYLDNNGQIYFNFVKVRLYFQFVKKRFMIIRNDKLFLFDLFNRIIFRKIMRPVK